MNIDDDFDQNYYVHIKDFLDPKICQKAVKHLFELYNNNLTEKDQQCFFSDSVYGDPFFDNLLNELAPIFSEISGKTLIPTYSYARIYRTGETLKIHKDRPACEISATITLGVEGDSWPIFFNKEHDIKGASKIILDIGDAALYKGCDIHHWREKYNGKWQCQVFFHYVDSNGPYKDEKFDRREKIGVKKTTNENNLDSIYYWYFDNALTHNYCDSLIRYFSNYSFEKGKIGGNLNEAINPEIRNVDKIQIDPGSSIGTNLIGKSFLANQQAWNYDINTCNQVEYLRYSSSGRYKPHVDTIFAQPDQKQRKLTALAFLNDDFEGGKLFLQVSEDRIYPLQTKGTIIVFPSYMLHGVEDVLNGTRHTVVCWMLGPNFK